MSMEMSMAAATEVNVPSNNQSVRGENHDQSLAAIPNAAEKESLLPRQGIENSAEQPVKPLELNREQLEMMAQKLQDFVGSLNRGLEFSVDEDSGRDVIKVIDRNSGETVRQYPSEEVLDLVASLSDAAGTFVNIKA